MSRRIFILLIVLMSTALIGIIAVQIYWINSSIEIREKQFSNDVKFALAKVSETIQEREFDDYYKEYSPFIDSVQSSLKTGKKDFYFQQIDTVKKEIFTFRQSILESNYKPSTSLFDSDNETVNFKSYFSEKEKEIKKINFNTNNDDLNEFSPEERIRKVGRLTNLDKVQYESYFKDIAPRKPIYDRISYNEIKINLDNELRNRGVDADFEFGVYNEGFATKLKSDKFRKERFISYGTPLFIDNEGNSDYQLFVSFPSKEKYILATISNILVFAAVFVLIIILAFAGALYQLIRQKQISEIKTDFINNMTHEFKTPIATINLALDAIKNPKIIGDKEKILRYADIIRQENKRMHGQVENVLQISKLEKNQLDLSSEVTDIHEVVQDAITHVDLIVQDKGGFINLDFNATSNEVMANKFHLTSIIVNMLDNAVKYTNEAPKIDISTNNAGRNIIIKIKDQGIGMSKNVQKNIFDKFYREQKGNIHDVKGHGLGLSYVKKIVEHHHGSVYVESEKGKGSTFTVKLPLI
jgi:two-component system phosphate regulon sensor histidine kinase PhoR